MSITIGQPSLLGSYSHNALGQRLTKTDEVSSNTLHFIYDLQGRLITEVDVATSATLREYIYVNGQQVALVDNTQTVNEAMYFVHNDHLGTPHRITDNSQALVWSADYEPFGQAAVTLNAINNNVRFPGQYSDVETGLHYNYFRDYDPSTGRYIESDPIGLAGGLNTYGYVNGNPVRYIDPLGLQPSLNLNGIFESVIRTKSRDHDVQVERLDPVEMAMRDCFHDVARGAVFQVVATAAILYYSRGKALPTVVIVSGGNAVGTGFTASAMTECAMPEPPPEEDCP